MPTIERVSAEEARDRESTGQALLVCAYDSDEKFNDNHLDGAISSSTFHDMLTSVSKTREIIFYCA